MKNKRIEIPPLLNKPYFSFEKFHQRTKFRKLIRDISPDDWPKEWKQIYYKGYQRLDEIVLPKPKLPLVSYLGTITNRRSSRIFPKKLSLKEISSLLYYSAGARKNGYRFYPSPGARFPLEVYILSLNSDLPMGIYHYYIKKNSLEELLLFQTFDYEKYFNQAWIAKSSIIILISAVFERNVIKYGERGYRHILVEAGHMAQNFYLTSTALKISCCGIGGYVDDELNKLLDIDGVGESVVYVLALG